MTGEITLTGRVLPIGGLKEKALAAMRHGIKTIIIPEKNKKDLEDIPEEYRAMLTFIPVKTIDDVLDVVLTEKIAGGGREKGPVGATSAKDGGKNGPAPNEKTRRCQDRRATSRPDPLRGSRGSTMRIRASDLIIVTALAFSLACSRHTERKPGQFSSRLNRAFRQDVVSFDPVDAYSSAFNNLSFDIYESLYQYSFLSDPPEGEPLLAASLPRWSADHLSAIIPIKKGIHFADDPCFRETGGKGREVIAQDFVYSIKRLAVPALDSSGWWIVDGRLLGINALRDKLAKTVPAQVAKVLEEPIEGIRALDRYTLQIRLQKPCPQFTQLFTLGPTAVLPKEAVTEYGDSIGKIREHPVGSGAYQLVKHVPRQEILLRRNPTFHDDFYPSHASPSLNTPYYLEGSGKRLPLIEEIDIRIKPEIWSNWLSFLNGEIEVMEVPKDALGQVIQMGQGAELSPEMKAKHLRLQIVNSISMYYLGFNMRDPLVGQNKLLRQALSSALELHPNQPARMGLRPRLSKIRQVRPTPCSLGSPTTTTAGRTAALGGQPPASKLNNVLGFDSDAGAADRCRPGFCTPHCATTGWWWPGSPAWS